MKCRFSLNYRDLEEVARIRGAKIDHATLGIENIHMIQKKRNYWS